MNTTTNPATTTSTPKRWAAYTTLTLTLWPIQYGLVVPAQMLWRLTKALGLWIVFLFIPIAGWIVLAVVLHKKLTTPGPVLGPRNYSLRPWMIDKVRAL